MVNSTPNDWYYLPLDTESILWDHVFLGVRPPSRQGFLLLLILSVILKKCVRATLVGLMIFRSVCVLLERNVCERGQCDGFDTGSVNG